MFIYYYIIPFSFIQVVKNIFFKIERYGIFMKNRIRYTVEKVLSNSFYQMPKFLFTGEFAALSNDARVLYMLLKDRHELSIKNEWYNDKKEVYLIMKREEMETMLNLSAPTIRKAIKELKELNLIDEERQGLNKPNLLYLMECKNLSVQSEKKLQSKLKENYNQERKDFSPNHTNQKNHTNSSDTYSIDSEIPVDNSNQKSFDDIRMTDKSNNLNIQNLISKYPDRYSTLTEIDNLISNVYSSREQTFRVGRKNIPTYEVRYALRSIDNRHIEYILNSLKNTDNVKDFKAYLLTSLYNSTKISFIDADAVRNKVENNINLNSLLSKYPNERKDLMEINEIIIETLIAKKKSFRIAMGELPSDFVKQSFAALTDEHVEYVLKSLRENTTPVKSVKAYIQTCLFNSTKTISNHISLDVQRWLYEDLGIEPKLR
jgi:DNA-binding transcriptional ArsR family regulator